MIALLPNKNYELVSDVNRGALNSWKINLYKHKVQFKKLIKR